MIYMAMNRFLFVMWMVGMLFLSSCSIKEDRDGCPCWMTVEMPGQAGYDGEKVGQDGRSPVGAGDDESRAGDDGRGHPVHCEE